MLDVFDLTAARPAGDILSRVVRVTIGGKEYELPVRSIKGNREFREGLEAGTQSVLNALDSKADLSGVFDVLATQLPLLLDLLIAYDTSGVLPSKDEIEAIEPDCSLDVVNAVREVWRAANPLVVTTLRAMDETLASPSSEPTSSPPARTAGSRRKSKSN